MRTPACFLIAATLCAQTFEVASVKVNHSDDGRSSYPNLIDGKLTAHNATMQMMLQVAYGLTSAQIEGPSWFVSDRFDLNAKSPDGVSDAEIKPMLQALLKDRFKLAAHIETREMPVYNLVVVKDGLKCPPFDPEHIPKAPPRPPGADSAIMGPMTMDGLTQHATSASGRPVINRTGLEGRYFCVAFFSNLSTDSSTNGPGDIFAAMQNQLGLKLEPAKAPLDVLIIDHIERTPTEN